MDSEALREQRRKRILENSRSRMERILGTVGESPSREPIVDGLGHSSGPFDEVARSRFEGRKTNEPEADDGAAEMESDLEDDVNKEYPLSPQPDHHRINSCPRTSVRTDGSTPKPWVMWILCRRQFTALIAGAILRIALWLSLLPWDGSLFPYILAFEIIFETTLPFLIQRPFTNIRSGPVQRLKATCWRLFDDFLLILSGFVFIHVFFELLKKTGTNL